MVQSDGSNWIFQLVTTEGAGCHIGDCELSCRCTLEILVGIDQMFTLGRAGQKWEGEGEG